MIGLFDTGHGGLTIYKALRAAMPQRQFVYFGDHGRAPYGTKSAAEILELTKSAIITLFERGCPLVVLACNTATAIALRTLQQEWLPHSQYKNRRVLGIIVPTVEIATTSHADANETLAVFATQRTIESGVFEVEIHKRNPLAKIIPQICPHLAGAIEAGASEDDLEQQVQDAVAACLEKTNGTAPQRAILGCTHFPIVEHLFKKYLPSSTVLFSQGSAVADRLADYLQRHPEFNQRDEMREDVFLTSGDAMRVRRDAERFLGLSLPFERCAK
ncbi:MAG: glutamate racemase [Alphaproteobacteria bacterium]|nr:glutamate racemase [Alphaproteobacteria bacterium]